MDFNEYKNSYVETIENSLRFTGKEHDFFTQVKADCLKMIINKYLPKVPKPSLLDIGCGHGLIHKHLANTNLEITGIEVADQVLQMAQQLNTHVHYINHDGKTIPFDAQQFDIAIAICVMHHISPSEWPNFLQEMKRVVKPGGIAIIFEHNPFNPATRYIVANNILDVGAVLVSNLKLKKMMKKAGFINVKSKNILFTPFSHPIFRWLDRALSFLPLGAQYYTIGKV